MHPVGPLQTYDCAFDAWQKPEGNNQGGRKPDREVCPQFWMVEFFEEDEQWDHQVTYDNDCQIGWGVVGSVVEVFGLAVRADWCDF